MKLKTIKREGKRKSEASQLRRQGQIPAILYSSERKPELVAIDAMEFNAILRGLKPGRLPTTKFKLSLDGKERHAIIKDIQYEVTNYRIFHLDFEELFDQTPVDVKVPIDCIGVVECVGVKLGGFLRQVIRHVKVRCLPKHIPAEFVIDVRDLGIRQSKRLSDLTIPSTVKPLVRLEEVVVVVAKR